MIRLLHVYSGNLYGGIETALVALARHRALCPELTQEVALCFDGRLRRELDAAGIRVHGLPAPRASVPHTVARARRALAALLANESFDRVVCHAAWSQALFGGIVRRARIPLVFWAHDAVTGRHWTERLARRVPPDFAICNSRFTADALTSIYPDVPSTVLAYAVDLQTPALTPGEVMDIRGSLHTKDDHVVIVQASRMEAWKGHAVLLEALAQLADRRQWVCWIVGGPQRAAESTYADSLRELARRLGIADRVRLVGASTDVPRLLAAADIYCQANIGAEPFGVVFIEALAAGLPVVASAIGGPTDIITDACGRLVPPGDATALSATLRTLVDDGSLRRLLGRAAPRRAQQLCDPPTQIRRLYEALASPMRSVVSA
ncbi:MAG TPA: glycosyltransferase [Candidatus Elarobacter sp.]|nr:glycosyltransferase [Candidatus Elarobacter sp.]